MTEHQTKTTNGAMLPLITSLFHLPYHEL